MSSDATKKYFEQTVTGDESAIVDQTRAYARRHLKEAAEDIDLEMGEGASKAHPELLTAYMQVRAQHEDTLKICRTLQEGFSVTNDTMIEQFDDIACLIKEAQED